MRRLICLNFFIIFITLGCFGQPISIKLKQQFEFDQLIFHLSGGKGSCPEIDMNIYKDKTIELFRTVNKPNGKKDSVRSGTFKGHLNEKSYNKIMGLLNGVNWDTTTFSRVLCCNKPLNTLILYHNNKSERFKSIEIPQTVTPLINYLINVACNEKLPRYNHRIDFEDILD